VYYQNCIDILSNVFISYTYNDWSNQRIFLFFIF
jgi:hypothetical protein